MMPLSFSLGISWLIMAALLAFFIPCVHLWRSSNFIPPRASVQEGAYAVFGVLKAFCLISFVIALGPIGFYAELHPLYAARCLDVAGIFFSLWALMLYFEAPICGLFDADDEEVLTDKEMLALWYGGLNEKYFLKKMESYRSEHRRAISEKAAVINFSHTWAWAWDNPCLRAAAYFLKGQSTLYAVSFLLVQIMGFTYDDVRTIRNPSCALVQDTAVLSFLCVRIPMTILMTFVFFLFANAIRREWMPHYRELILALKEGRDPDLSDRARMAEMRRTVLGWGVNSGYVRYDRDRGVWLLNAQKGRMIG